MMQSATLGPVASTLLAVAGAAGWMPPVSAEPSSTSSFEPIATHILGMSRAGGSRFAVADVDGDGIADLVFCGQSGGTALAVVGRRNDGSIGFKQTTVLPDLTDIVRVLDATVEGVTHIYTIAHDGTVRDFSGWPLEQQETWSVDGGVSAAAIGDLYGNGESALVVTTDEGVHAYALVTGVSLWTYPLQGITDVTLAQLDGDPALEVILGAMPGIVLDGATQAIDWQYDDGFESPLTSGHLEGDSTTQFVGASYGYFTVFRGSPWSPLWAGGDTAWQAAALSTAALDNGGRDVVIEGDSQFGSVRVFDAATHQQRFAIPNPAWGISALASLDIDGGGVADIAFAATYGYGAINIEVVASDTHDVAWSYRQQYGIFSSTAIGDVDGGGNLEFVVANDDGVDAGPIEIYDVQSGALKWQSPLDVNNGNDPFYVSAARTLLVNHPGTTRQDIVIAGSDLYDGRITVIDGVSHAATTLVYGYGTGPLASREIVDAVALDYDGDGVQDFAVATQPTTTAASGALLQVFSGIDGHALWTSEVLGGGFARIGGVLTTGSHDDPAAELIAVLPTQLRAFNVRTQMVDWSLSVVADGALYLPHGFAGPEILVFSRSGTVAVYDADTRGYLRGFTVSSGLDALTAIDGNATRLVAASNGGLVLLDGRTGSPLARSDFLGNDLGSGNQLSVASLPDATFLVGSGSGLGAFLHRLRTVADDIFESGFETP